MTRRMDQIACTVSSRGSLTGTKDLGVKRLGIVFVKDMGGDVGGLMEDHNYFRKLKVEGEEEEDRKSVGRGLER